MLILAQTVSYCGSVLPALAELKMDPLFLLRLLAFVFVASLGILNLIMGVLLTSALHGACKKVLFVEATSRSMLTLSRTDSYSGSDDLRALAALKLDPLPLLLLLAFFFGASLGIRNLIMGVLQTSA